MRTLSSPQFSCSKECATEVGKKHITKNTHKNEYYSDVILLKKENCNICVYKVSCFFNVLSSIFKWGIV